MLFMAVGNFIISAVILLLVAYQKVPQGAQSIPMLGTTMIRRSKGRTKPLCNDELKAFTIEQKEFQERL